MPFVFFEVWPVKGFPYLLVLTPALVLLAARWRTTSSETLPSSSACSAATAAAFGAAGVLLDPTVGQQDQVVAPLEDVETAAVQDGLHEVAAHDEGGARAAIDRIVALMEAEGMTAREALGAAMRQTYAEATGYDHDHATDAELLDGLVYNVFPNFAPWGGFMPNIVYRWRPGKTPDTCLMEVRILSRVKKGEPMPHGVPMHYLTAEQKWTDAPEIGAPAPSNTVAPTSAVGAPASVE